MMTTPTLSLYFVRWKAHEKRGDAELAEHLGVTADQLTSLAIEPVPRAPGGSGFRSTNQAAPDGDFLPDVGAVRWLAQRHPVQPNPDRLAKLVETYRDGTVMVDDDPLDHEPPGRV